MTAAGARSPLRRAARRVVVTLAGGGLLLAGAAMLVLPGPGALVCIAGLAVLATEYAWAQRLLGRFQARAGRAATVVLADRRARRSFIGTSVLLVTAGAAVLVASSIDGVPGPLDALASGAGGRTVGVTLMLAGVAGLGLLVPGVQRRLGLAPAPAGSG